MPHTPDQDMISADELLDALPYGIIVLSDDRKVVHATAPAREYLPGDALPSSHSCSDLFSCQSPGGPCESGCLVTRAKRSSSPAPEMRVDTAGGTSPGALWITVSLLPERGVTILHLRPGWRGDRRRRWVERWSSEPQLRIRTLGRTHVEARDDSLESDWLSQKPGHVLKYLVCERERVVMVDEIGETIWPNSGRRAISNTRYAIHRLRMKLEPRRAAHDPATFVVARDGGYALDRKRLWIDVDEFEQEVELGRTALGRLDPAAADQHLRRAMEIYRGPFMADEPYAHWVSDERNRLAGMAIYALRILTALARERGDASSAIEHLKRLAELEPLDSGAHRELVQALLAGGLRSEAKRRYDSFAHRLWRELGEEPGFDIRSLT